SARTGRATLTETTDRVKPRKSPSISREVLPREQMHWPSPIMLRCPLRCRRLRSVCPGNGSLSARAALSLENQGVAAPGSPGIKVGLDHSPSRSSILTAGLGNLYEISVLRDFRYYNAKSPPESLERLTLA